MTCAKDRLILALDTSDAASAWALVEELRDFVGLFKVGLELFCRYGPDILKQLNTQGVPVFFDSKLLDIPNTTAKASEGITLHGVKMFNVHASGGKRMLESTGQAVKKAALEAQVARPKVIAVTVLTSISQRELNDELGVGLNMDDQVCRLALMAKEAGLDGVVASASEAPRLRKLCGSEFLIVTPGIRPEWAAANDQSRIVTPYQAIRNGSDCIVVGRPITAHADKRDAAARVVAEIQKALDDAKAGEP